MNIEDGINSNIAEVKTDIGLWKVQITILNTIQCATLIICIALLIAVVLNKVKNKKLNKQLNICFIISIIIFIIVSLIRFSL